MSKWTHALCDDCYAKHEPHRTPIRVSDSEVEDTCCECGEYTTSGIYYRSDPNNFKCGGNHNRDNYLSVSD